MGERKRMVVPPDVDVPEAENKPKESEKKVPEPQTRQRGSASSAACPKCGSANTFVTKSKNYPDHLAVRLRYYRCGSCGHSFKL